MQRRFATLLKKRPWRRFFPVNFTKFLRTPFCSFFLLPGVRKHPEIVLNGMYSVIKLHILACPETKKS